MQSLFFLLWFITYKIGQNHPWFMEPNLSRCKAFLRCCPFENGRFLVGGFKGFTLTDKGAQLAHFGQNHRNDFYPVNLVCGEFSFFFGLHDQNTQPLAEPLDWDTQKGRVNLFTRFRHISKAFFFGGICCIDHASTFCHTPDETFPHAQACLMDRFSV